MNIPLGFKRAFILICSLLGTLSIGFMAMIEDPGELLFTLTFPMAMYCLKGKGTNLGKLFSVLLIIFTSLSLGSVIYSLQTLGLVDLYPNGIPSGIETRFNLAALGCGFLTGKFCNDLNR